ncbi:substrate-binding domain-containing protein [Leptothrix discophora]|uniref:Substrate-binding domain-containing protein n=1 Tax=Leptothrix discophora TaxID=89 RepID=A0ABT9G849_LEPDI|nr:substrate-binding domain-containing protein [Leptothrix discophora]MDP4302659.1 substrate-binding domain-containing protein [Leptothrix discophora]
MMFKRFSRSRSWLCAALLALACSAQANDLKVIAPNAVKEAVVEIASRFEKDTGLRVSFTWGGSEAIAKRVADGEVFDVVVNTSSGVDRMAADGKLVSGSRTDFSRSAVAAAARSGLPRPDVSSVNALRATLLDAQSIAISSGASGRYLEQLFQKLGVAEQIKSKIRQPPSGAQIGDMLARGEADLGFQQVTELMHAQGFQYLGPLPAELQNYTVWASGIHSSAPQADAARAFTRALSAPASGASIRKSGMEPM